jgi:hypothetical protein
MHETVLEGCTYLGGCSYPLAPGDSATLSFGTAALSIRLPDGASFSVPYVELASIDISGPGTTTTGGSFMGGGFGVEGALEGIAIATVLNTLTTKSKVHTFVSLITNIGELHLHYRGMEPGALRVALAPIYATLRRLDPVWRQGRLAALQFAQTQDVLSEPEFAQLSKRLGEPIKEALIPPPAKPKTFSAGRSDAHLVKARTMRGLGFDRHKYLTIFSRSVSMRLTPNTSFRWHSAVRPNPPVNRTRRFTPSFSQMSPRRAGYLQR